MWENEGAFRVCAIFGIVGDYDLKSAEKAFGSLQHRGRDGSGSIALPSLFLGAHRLAITSYGNEMTQPLEKEGVHFVFNGEIYNRSSLKKELGLESVDEVTLLAACYKEYGENFVTYLRGMYAIAIIESGSVKLYRDPAGKKPLYYRHTSGGLHFSSEIKALLTIESTAIDTEQIPVYLSYQSTVAPHTFYKGIRQLGAGELLHYDGSRISTRTFHDLPTPSRTSAGHARKLSQIGTTLEEAVSLRIPRTVPYAVLLSGGVDSSLVAAIAAKRGPLHSYSVGYEGFEKYDERAYARTAALHIGAEHHEVLFGKEDFFRSIEHIVDLMDEPLADPAIVPLYYLMQQISAEGFRVVLTGDGSDELFMGYRTYAEFVDLEQLGSLNNRSWLRNHLKSHFSMHREWEWHKRVLEGSLLFRGSSELFTDLQQNRLLKRNIKDNHSLQAIEAYRKAYEASGRDMPADWYSYLDIKIQLGEVFLKRLDRVGMAHGIEARTPFLDKELVSTLLSLDAELRMGSERKHLLKTIALEYLPASIVQRKKKGFNYPFLEWLQEENALTLIERVQKERGVFREEHLHYLIEEGGRGKFRHQLFALYMLCRWLIKTEGE